MTRRWLRRVARSVVAALLFTQLAVAAYACPDVFGAGADADAPIAAIAAAFTDDGIEPASGSQPQAPRVDATVWEISDAAHLCVEHCKSGQQIDHSISIAVPVPWPTALYVRKPTRPSVPAKRADGAVLNALVATSPPHAILHCVRRT